MEVAEVGVIIGIQSQRNTPAAGVGVYGDNTPGGASPLCILQTSSVVADVGVVIGIQDQWTFHAAGGGYGINTPDQRCRGGALSTRRQVERIRLILIRRNFIIHVP